MEYEVTIPHFYKWMAAGNKERYIGYIKGYIALVEPDLKPIRVEGKIVICIKK
jgi:hypothetical protein